MPAQQMRDLLHLTEQFHGALAEYYQSIENAVRREDVKQTLDFLSRHEQFIMMALEEYERSAPKGVADAWFTNFPGFKMPEPLKEQPVDPEMSVEELLELALHFDNSLIAWYQQIAARDLPDELRAAIESILELEREEEKRIVRGVQQLQ